MFGDTPTGIIILDFILVVMGMILSPLLWGIFSRLGKIGENLTMCVKSLSETQGTLAEVVKELNDTKVRDKDIEGRLKGINEKLDNHIREDQQNARKESH